MAAFNVILIFMLFLFIHDSSGKFIVRPRNVAILQGEQVRMECRSDTLIARLRWNAMFYTSTVETQISTGDRIFDPILHPMFSIDNNTEGQFDLIIRSCSMAFAGRYTCIEPGSAVKGSAELIVLASDPECHFKSSVHSLTTLTKQIFIRCYISFRGNLAPMTECHQELPQRPHSPLIVNEHRTNAASLDYSATIDVISCDSDVTYTCRTSFSNTTTPPAMEASNVPDYSFVWNFTTMLYTCAIPEKLGSLETGRHDVDNNSLISYYTSGIVGISCGLTLVIAAQCICNIVVWRRYHRHTNNRTIEPDSTVNDYTSVDYDVMESNVTPAPAPQTRNSYLSLRNSFAETVQPVDYYNAGLVFEQQVPGSTPVDVRHPVDERHRQIHRRTADVVTYENSDVRSKLQNAFRHKYCNSVS